MVKQRTFSIAFRKCPAAPTGGPGGVNYRLYLANKKYHYFEALYNVFHDRVLENDCEHIIKFHKEGMSDTEYLTSYLLKLHEYYRFTDEDIFIIHDVLSANVLYNLHPFKHTILVYHQQGSLYREWEYLTGKQDCNLKVVYDNLLKEVFSTMKYVAFPSYGAIESIIASEPTLEEVIQKADVKVLYNGCDCEQNLVPVSENAKTVINLIQSQEIPSFITAATLNTAKGVERLPEFLAKIKEQYGDFLWIVIGNGVTADAMIENAKKYGVYDNLVWLNKRIPHDDLLALYQYTDFYLLAHRFSIFDFATIEAMHYGNIPILTPVGGNKEMIVDNNGIFINDLSSIKEFQEFMENQDVNVAREKNVILAQERFSEEAFIKGYARLADEFLH